MRADRCSVAKFKANLTLDIAKTSSACPLPPIPCEKPPQNEDRKEKADPSEFPVVR